MQLHASGENYLKAMLVLKQQKGIVRSVDLAQYMGYTLPSISHAVALLKDGGFLKKDREGFLNLTENGQRVAENMCERHQLLMEILTSLGVSIEIAEQDACQMEHVISEESFQKLKQNWELSIL